jgi:hypothetical protein
MLPISMNNLIRRSSSHDACGSFNSRVDFFGDHQFSFQPGTPAATHQLHRPECDYGVCFDRQFHQRSVRTPASNQFHADRRCDLLVFFAARLAGFLLSMGISISLWPADAFRGFLDFGPSLR